MNRKIDSNYGDTERSRIITLAQIYERTADELAFWNAKAAEELYRKIIYMLIPLAPLNYNLVRMLQKMAKVQMTQGKIEESEATLVQYKEIQLKLSEFEAEVRREHPEFDEQVIRHCEQMLAGLALIDEEHDRNLVRQYRQALDSTKYTFDYYPEICEFFKKRGISLCVGNPTGGILLTGINPSLNPVFEGRDFAYTFKNAMIEAKNKIAKGRKTYWTQKYNLIGDELVDVTAYLDLYPFVFTNQDVFEELIEKNLQFRAEIVSITQREIETYIKPVLIIVANKQSSYYWGRNENATWMGYDMVKIRDDMELYQIKGFKVKTDRLNSDMKTSSLSGSLILFYGMYDDRHKDKLLTKDDINELYNYAKLKKQEWGIDSTTYIKN